MEIIMKSQMAARHYEDVRASVQQWVRSLPEGTEVSFDGIKEEYMGSDHSHRIAPNPIDSPSLDKSIHWSIGHMLDVQILRREEMGENVRFFRSEFKEDQPIPPISQER